MPRLRFSARLEMSPSDPKAGTAEVVFAWASGSAGALPFFLLRRRGMDCVKYSNLKFDRGWGNHKDRGTAEVKRWRY